MITGWVGDDVSGPCAGVVATIGGAVRESAKGALGEGLQEGQELSFLLGAGSLLLPLDGLAS